jgi:F0F1-type ATP synthase assembly protein I
MYAYYASWAGESSWNYHMSYARKPQPSKSTWPEVIRTVGKYMDLGLIFVAAIGGGALGGYWLDAHLGTTPWLFLAGALLGITAGFYHFFSVVLRK